LQRSNAIGNGQGSPSAPTLPYSLDKDAIIADLTTERPQWILSAYGPGRQAPEQLFGGDQREQSFEEMRLLHYMGLASGNAQQAVSRIGEDGDLQPN
jgi:nucleoporin NUP42